MTVSMSRWVYRIMSSPPPAQLALYHYTSCGFCRRVRRAIERLGIGDQIELRDVSREPAHRRTLEAARGRGTVPVLRITSADDDVWMPESLDIIAYLEQRFARRATRSG